MSHHHKSGTQKRKEKAVRVEGVKGQKTLEQHGFDVAEDSEGTDRERNTESMQQSAECGSNDISIRIRSGIASRIE